MGGSIEELCLKLISETEWDSGVQRLRQGEPSRQQCSSTKVCQRGSGGRGLHTDWRSRCPWGLFRRLQRNWLLQQVWDRWAGCEAPTATRVLAMVPFWPFSALQLCPRPCPREEVPSQMPVFWKLPGMVSLCHL